MANNRSRYEEALNRGHAFSWDQRWDDAVREFEAAIAEFPAEPAPYAGLGMAFVELGQLDRALEGYKLAARYSQGDIIYLRQVAEVQERLHLAADAGQTYMAIGEILLRQRLLEEAMENWHRAVRLDPHLLGGINGWQRFINGRETCAPRSGSIWLSRVFCKTREMPAERCKHARQR